MNQGHLGCCWIFQFALDHPQRMTDSLTGLLDVLDAQDFTFVFLAVDLVEVIHATSPFIPYGCCTYRFGDFR